MTAQEIRKDYPAPTTYMAGCAVYDDEPAGYCVGGALGFFLGFEDGFPTTDDVAMYLDIATGMGEDLAAEFAEDITHLNDDEDFSAAWNMLDAALAYVA